MQTKSWFQNIWKQGILFGMAVCTFVMACRGFHDIQTAEGVGLYIAISLQKGNRLAFDLLVDVLGAAGLFLCVALPCITRTKKYQKVSLMLVTYVALMPVVSPASLIHLFDNPENYKICSSLEELMEGGRQLAPVAGFWIPALCLLRAAGRIHGTNTHSGIRHRIFLASQSILAAFLLLFPRFAFFLSFIMQYLFLLSTFEAWEELHRNDEKFSVWEVILFLGLWLRGGYVLFELISRY